jgi:hypothetical protein
MTLLTGWLATAGAFFGVLILASAFLGPGLAFVAAVFAGIYPYKHFEDKYKVELAALQNPPPEVWSLSLPNAWTCMKDTLALAHVESGVSGVSNWHILQEDTTRGSIQAELNFQQSLGSPNQPSIFKRTVQLNAILTPEGDNTRVEIHYSIFSPNGTGLVENVMKVTQAQMKHQVAITKGAS